LKRHKAHIIFYPISILFGIVTFVRNWLFDKQILTSTSFKIPIISVGNLAVGGTGKTPHTEFLLSFLQNEWTVAVLSRGYLRKTKGFYLADEKSNSNTLGDEPYQIHKKFPNIVVAVDEKRVRGVKKLQEIHQKLQIVVLDDAFQHRYIQAGLSILLTDYSNLYINDTLLPAGNLREYKSGSNRANIIIVTKCPTDLRPIEMRMLEQHLMPQTNQALFFSCFQYDEVRPVFSDIIAENWNFKRISELNANVLLVAGIVNPQPIVEYLSKYTNNIETCFFEDHHSFDERDFRNIQKLFDAIASTEKILLVTEKDAARLVSNKYFPEQLKSKTFALPISVKILNNQENIFIQKIKNYVIENSRNS
jgi:tetraacyldisaccharide 4'-kinase